MAGEMAQVWLDDAEMAVILWQQEKRARIA
jgi:hypothetical protein